MRVKDIMTADPTCCTPETSLQEVAKRMKDEDCGCLPVVENEDTMMPVIGTITDRDIVCRVVAEGDNPLNLKASDCMSTPVVTVSVNADIAECCRLMEDNQIRRIPVIDDEGTCCGMVAQADIARIAPEHMAGDLVKEVSKATSSASAV